MWMPSGSQWGSPKEFRQQSCLNHGISEVQSSSGMHVDGEAWKPFN